MSQVAIELVQPVGLGRSGLAGTLKKSQVALTPKGFSSRLEC